MMRKREWIIYASVFVSGAVILVLEILGTRILAPFYGSTIFVWSSLISVTLASLALGYFLGGIVADKSHNPRLFAWFLIEAGFAMLLIYRVKGFILLWADQFGLQYGPLAAAFVLFALPLMLLGMLTPFAVRLSTKEVNTVGVHAGLMYTVGTLGSLAGAIIAGFYIIPIMPIAEIIKTASVVLVALGAIGLVVFSHKQRKVTIGEYIMVGLMIISALGWLWIRHKAEPPMTYRSHAVFESEIVMDHPTPLAHFKVVAVPRALDGRFCLLIDSTVQGCIDPRNKDTSAQYRRVAHLLKPLESDADMLMLGAGIGIYLRDWVRSDINVDIVDINPFAGEVLTAGGVALDPDRQRLIISDARTYLRTTPKKYDVIYNDLFGNAAPVSHLVSREAYQLIKKRLTENGLMITNVVGKTNGEDHLVNSFVTTVKEVFPYVALASTNRDQFFKYVLIIGSKQPVDWQQVNETMAAASQEKNLEGLFIIPDLEGDVITDDFNPVDQWWSTNINRNETVKSFRSKFKRLAKGDWF